MNVQEFPDLSSPYFTLVCSLAWFRGLFRLNGRPSSIQMQHAGRRSRSNQLYWLSAAQLVLQLVFGFIISHWSRPTNRIYLPRLISHLEFQTGHKYIRELSIYFLINYKFFYRGSIQQVLHRDSLYRYKTGNATSLYFIVCVVWKVDGRLIVLRDQKISWECNQIK